MLDIGYVAACAAIQQHEAPEAAFVPHRCSTEQVKQGYSGCEYWHDYWF